MAPQIGASIGIFPSAARVSSIFTSDSHVITALNDVLLLILAALQILDQLGAWKGVSEAAVRTLLIFVLIVSRFSHPHPRRLCRFSRTATIRGTTSPHQIVAPSCSGQGKLSSSVPGFLPVGSDYGIDLTIGLSRTGYSTAWGERQTLLRVLHDNIKDSSKVLVNKGLADIKHEADGVTAICEDGSSYSGHLLVGTDGVFSKTRSKMWELAESDHPELVRADRNCKSRVIGRTEHPAHIALPV